MQSRNARYANERRRPRIGQSFKVGDVIITKGNLRRRIIEQVGPYTFKLDDGFKINSRSILRKVSPKEVSAPTPGKEQCNKDSNVTPNYQWIHLPCSDTLTFTDILPSNSTPVDSATSPDQNVSPSDLPSTTDLPTDVKRGRRQRKTPTYLSDYLT